MGFLVVLLRGGGGGGGGWLGGCRKGVHLASLCFISATYVSSQRSTSLKTLRTHAPHYHLVLPKTKQHGQVGVHFCTAVLVCCFSRGGGLGGVGGGEYKEPTTCNVGFHRELDKLLFLVSPLAFRTLSS